MAEITTTTLSAAVTGNDEKVITPASMTGIEVNDVLFIGQEAMIVNSLQTATVTVQRGRYGTLAVDHLASDRIWHGPQSQFKQRDPVGVEPNAPVDTPWINMMNGSIWRRGKDNAWRRGTDRGRAHRPMYEYTEPGAITLEEGIHILNGDGADAMTLAAPSVDMDGMRMVIFSNATQAFTVTATGLFRGDSDSTDDDVATFSLIGDSMELVAFEGLWLVINSAVGAAASGVVFT